MAHEQSSHGGELIAVVIRVLYRPLLTKEDSLRSSLLEQLLAVKSSGTVVCWDMKWLVISLHVTLTIFSNWYAYAGLTVTGKLEAWGGSSVVGSPRPFLPMPGWFVYHSNSAFAALLNDGSLVCWGSKIMVENAIEPAKR